MTDASDTLPLSCYIRTHNEARNIDNVVRAARTVADEVIVIDAGSNDGTVALAEAAGAKVIHNPWPGNGFQKRIGEEACRHDWLLDIDGDEVITPELATEIRALFANGEPAASVYEIKMVHAPPAGEPWWDFNPSFRRKLYDRRKYRMPEHKIWDQLPIPKSEPVPTLKGILLHYAFKDVEHVVAKYNGRSTARARDGKRKSKASLKLRLWFGLPVYFLKQFAGRGLWRAGTYGLIFAVLSAYMRWLRDAKMYEAILFEERNGRH
ncbi:glycosyltransferase family 2 protein [Asticcacaulis sp. SL142]|uniref:glycosyltransferase family 2 protein n=1 Tax=Asticcacaulis sp. SL142 TaxID=2995155 RepID=UPI00226CD567|nr:glycosyltransferase family 2 protein [Asticcacaulis sp. SL142]WAC49712.1 glycosyltransferase family 2 protein [Asticcacaulis sp. SL142]